MAAAFKHVDDGQQGSRKMWRQAFDDFAETLDAAGRAAEDDHFSDDAVGSRVDGRGICLL